MNAQETANAIMSEIKKIKDIPGSATADDIKDRVSGIISKNAPDIISDMACREKFYPDPYYEIKTDAVKRHEELKTIYRVKNKEYANADYQRGMAFILGSVTGISAPMLIASGLYPVLSGVCATVGALSFIYIFTGRKLADFKTVRKLKKLGIDTTGTCGVLPDKKEKPAEIHNGGSESASEDTAVELTAFASYFDDVSFDYEMRSLSDELYRLSCDIKALAGGLRGFHESRGMTSRLMSYYLPTIKKTVKKIKDIYASTKQIAPEEMFKSLSEMIKTTDQVVRQTYSGLFEYDVMDMEAEANAMKNISVMDGMLEDSTKDKETVERSMPDGKA